MLGLQAELRLDFSSLKRQYKATGRAERDQLDDQFRKDIEERGAQLARLVPNLKAIEQYEAVKVRQSSPCIPLPFHPEGIWLCHQSHCLQVLAER